MSMNTSTKIHIFIVLFLFTFSISYSWIFNKVTKSNNFNIKTENDKVKESTISSISTLSKALITISPLYFPLITNADENKQPKKNKKPKVLETELGIKYIELKKGSGPYPTPGDFVVISYSGFLSNGTVFDSTEAPGRKPLSFRFGKSQQIIGLESVLSNMQPGGECTCTIPPQYAFGSKGICLENEGCLVPPNETVRYVVKLRNVAASYG